MSALSIARSWLPAASDGFAASASNIANVNTSGSPPGASAPSQAAAGQPAVYEPVDTVRIGQAGGGVATTYRPRNPGYDLAYRPESRSANASGIVAQRNVDPARESGWANNALRTFQANADAMRTAPQRQSRALSKLV